MGLALLALAACADEDATSPSQSIPAPTFARGGSGDNNGRILFASYRDDSLAFELYSMNPDGSGVTRLTNSAGEDLSPAWSPDGKRVAFVSTRHDSRGEIYVMNADGTGVTRLTNSAGPDLSPTWSKDGKQIAFVSSRSDSTGDIYTMNAADGSGVTRVTNSKGYDWDPAWSPDGKQIAFVSERDGVGSGHTDLYVVTLDGLQVTRLTSETAHVRYPSWAPGGKQIAFNTEIDLKGDEDVLTRDIFVVDLDLMQVTRLTDGPGDETEDFDPSWSADGKYIAFASRVAGNVDVYAMNANGSGRTRLTTNGRVDTSPAWNR